MLFTEINDIIKFAKDAKNKSKKFHFANMNVLSTKEYISVQDHYTYPYNIEINSKDQYNQILQFLKEYKIDEFNASIDNIAGISVEKFLDNSSNDKLGFPVKRKHFKERSLTLRNPNVAEYFITVYLNDKFKIYLNIYIKNNISVLKDAIVTLLCWQHIFYSKDEELARIVVQLEKYFPEKNMIFLIVDFF